MIARPNAALAHIQTQIMWSRLIAVVEEQAQTLMRTAFSTPVREAGDLSAGVFDRDGNMLAQAVTGTPGHVNSMAAAIKHFLAAFPLATMKEGDHYITNDPWLTCGHLHDLTVVSPTFLRAPFAQDGPVGLFASTVEGSRRLVEMMEEFGIANLDRLGEHIIETSRQATLEAIGKLKPGKYKNSVKMDGYDRPLTLAGEMTI